MIFFKSDYLCFSLDVLLSFQEYFGQSFENVNELNLDIMDYWNLFAMRIICASDMLAFYLHILIILFASMIHFLLFIFCLYSHFEMHEEIK